MAEVFVDGEKVEFRGESPGSLGGVLNLVQGVLSTQSRVVASIQVDGNAYQEDGGSIPLESATRIEIGSLSESEVVRRLADSSLEEIAAVMADGRLLCGEVLRTPWSQIRERCVSVAERFGRSVQNVSVLVVHLGEESAFGRAAAGVNEALNDWIDAIGQGDAALACLRMSEGVLPAFDFLKTELAAIGETGA